MKTSKLDETETELRNRLRSRCSSLEAVSARDALDVALAFYRDTRVTGCDMTADGDMLLFQFGTHDWGQGEHFELDITRQFIVGDGEDDDIWQLHITIRYAPEAELRALANGNHWCTSVEASDEFDALVRASPAFRAAAGRSGTAEISFECAG